MDSQSSLDIRYPKAELHNNKLTFETSQGLSQALNKGIFYLRIPNDFDSRTAINFATNYYLDKEGVDEEDKGFRNVPLEGSILGYSSSNDQVELLQLEIELWSKYFPEAVTKMLHQMNNTSKAILKAIFE